MKIIGDIKKIGNKAYNIYQLSENKLFVPKTIILEIKDRNKFKEKLLNPKKIYIIRPSFNLEDGEKNSLAGYFKSFFPLKKEEIITIIKKNNLNKLFGGQGFELQSIIIQEYINTNIYGVYFSRNPNNIFKKGFYEIGHTNDFITSGKKEKNLKLNFFQNKEVELIGEKLENMFNNPQDIEFCIKNNKIIVLQSRPITTGNNTIYNFKEVKKINGIYTKLNFDELGEKQDYFSYDVLRELFPIILLNSKIYFKKTIIFSYIFKNIDKKSKFYNFSYNYKKYLIYKTFYYFIKLFFFQKLDKNILKDFFKKYNYSFLLNKKSNLKLKFNYKTNFITRLFLKLERHKNISFNYLEKYKKVYEPDKFYKNKQEIENIGDKLIIRKGVIKNIVIGNQKYNWIYKSKINGIITDLKNFKEKKGLNQVLIVKDLTINLYDKINYLNGIIIKNGNQLSHNSIILREYKIPSIIDYKEFELLKNGNKISI